ncbi:MAG TPA: hypothetical protein VNG51_20235 [Ktedonobacteraceae bacterium]|nr:hypothetical protein [Ktedonobacteraceae bacterium]
MMYESEVARIRRQIEAEIEALQWGLYGLAYGTSRHDFINKRMDSVGTYQTKLADFVGKNEADEMVVTLYNKTIK